MSSQKGSSSKSKKSLWKVSLTPKSKNKSSKDEDSESECKEEEEKVKPAREHKKRKCIGSDPLAIVSCTACNRQINPARDSVLRKHPDLSVLICKKCWSFYHSGEISKDEDGSDEQCRWCGEGGKLIGCDFCHNVFCKACILRNFGRSELSVILDDSDEDAKWRCYVCDEDKLKPLVEECDQLFKRVSEEKDKAKQVKKTNGVDKKSSHGKEFDVTINKSNVVEIVNRLSVINTCFQRVIDAVKTELQPDDDCDDDSASSSVLDSETRSRNALTLEKGIHSYLRSLQELSGSGTDKKSHSKDPISSLKKIKQENNCSDSTEMEDRVKSKNKSDKFSKKVTVSSANSSDDDKKLHKKHKSKDYDSESEVERSRKKKHTKHSNLVKTGKISKSSHKDYDDSEDDKSKKKKKKHGKLHKNTPSKSSSSESEEEKSSKKKENETCSNKDKKKSGKKKGHKSRKNQDSDSSSDEDDMKSSEQVNGDDKLKKALDSDNSSEDEKKTGNKKCQDSKSSQDQIESEDIVDYEHDSNSESLLKPEQTKTSVNNECNIDQTKDCIETEHQRKKEDEMVTEDLVESELDSNSESLLKPSLTKHNTGDKCDIDEGQNVQETRLKRKKGDLSSDPSDSDNKKCRLNDSAITDTTSDCDQNDVTLPIKSSELSINRDETSTSEVDDDQCEKESFPGTTQTHEKIVSSQDKKVSAESSDDKSENQSAKMALIQELAAELCKDNSSSSSDFDDIELTVNKNTSSEDDDIDTGKDSRSEKTLHKSQLNDKENQMVSSPEIADNVKSSQEKEQDNESDEDDSKLEKTIVGNYSDMTASESENEVIKDKISKKKLQFEGKSKFRTQNADDSCEDKPKNKTNDSNHSEVECKSKKKNRHIADASGDHKSKSIDENKMDDSNNSDAESKSKMKNKLEVKADDSSDDKHKSKKKHMDKADDSSDDDHKSKKKHRDKADDSSNDKHKSRKKHKEEADDSSDDDHKSKKKHKDKADDSSDDDDKSKKKHKDKADDSSNDKHKSRKKHKEEADDSSDDDHKSKKKHKDKADDSSDDDDKSKKKHKDKADDSSDDDDKSKKKHKDKADDSSDDEHKSKKNHKDTADDSSNDKRKAKKKHKDKADDSSDDKHQSKKKHKEETDDSSDDDHKSKKKNKEEANDSSYEHKSKKKNKEEADDSSYDESRSKKKGKNSRSSSEDEKEKPSSSKVKPKMKGSKKAKSDVKKTKEKKNEKYTGYYNDDDVSSSDLIMSSSGDDFQPTTPRRRAKKTNKVVKKGKKKEDNSNSEEESDSDFDYNKSKTELKKSIKEEKETKEKAKDRRKAKEMEESDSDTLDKEICKLEKAIEKTQSKKKESSNDDDSSSTDKKKENGKAEKTKEKSKKKKSKGSNNDESSSDEDDDGKKNKDIVDEDSSSSDDAATNKTLPMPKLNGKDENEEAKKDLIAELKSKDEDSSSVDEDTDDDVPKKKDTSKKAKVKDENEEENSDSDFEPAKKKRFRSTLLDAKVSSSDSDKPTKKKKKKDDNEDSDYNNDVEENSDESDIGRKKKKKSKDTSNSESGSDSDDDDKKKKRKRIKRPKNSSDEEDDDEKDSPTKGGRKKIRKVMSDKKVADETKAAAKAEEDRRQRVSDLQKKFNIVTVEDSNSPTKCPMTTKLVLESNKDGEPLIAVNKHLIKKLKPHQVEAIQFMWSCCIESLKRLKKEEGSGCILAHCMGLGKTLSVVSFVHTVLAASEYTKMTTCLIVSPLNTVLNWRNECSMWLKQKDQLTVYELSSVKDNHSRARYLREWMREGGIMIIGYEMYRNLTNTGRVRNKKLKKTFEETLVDPGPDLCVCDEGHILKNEQSAISQSMNKIKTKRRIVLTGTPLQNNLNEYHCMLSFVKPRLLGTRKEFLNRFVNPITNGQCSDSTAQDVKVMKRRAHVLHEMLAGCVQRKDYSALTKYLPPKLEYVISVRLAPVQMTLYEKYLESVGQTGTVSGKGGRLFQDYQALSKIWTHPWVLKLSEIKQEAKVKYDDYEDEDEELSNDSFIDDSTSDSSPSTDDNSDDISLKDSDSDNPSKRTKNTRAKTKDKKKKNRNEPSTSSGKQEDKKEIVNNWKTRSRGGGVPEEELLTGLDENTNKLISSEWWAEYLKEEDKHKLEISGKLSLLFKILSMCEEIGDKILVFSQSLLSLDIIEDFLDTIDKKWQEEANEKSEEEKQNTFGKSWTKGADYFRMDGSTSVALRQSWAEHFNDPENYRARLFIISTKAGGLGINLVGANRAIIFDASWNPSHDIQSIFRAYRFGQVKPVYIYRFLAQGTMEEKIYERQVTKQSLSQRVVDEHQIERHFTANDLQELYAFRPDRLDDPNRVEKTPILPKDTLLAELLKSEKDWIVTYHEHNSLLENKIGDALSEEERKSAWEEYETDKDKQPVRAPMNSMYANGMMANTAFNSQMTSVHQRAFSAENVSQVVQLVRSKFPHLQGDMFQAQVQNIIMQQIMQYNQQQEQELAIRQRQELERLRLLQNQVASRQRLFNQASVRPPQEVWVRPKIMPAGAQSSRSSNMTSLIRNQLTGNNSSDKSKTSKPNPGEKTPDKNPPPSVDLTKS